MFDSKLDGSWKNSTANHNSSKLTAASPQTRTQQKIGCLGRFVSRSTGDAPAFSLLMGTITDEPRQSRFTQSGNEGKASYTGVESEAATNEIQLAEIQAAVRWSQPAF